MRWEAETRASIPRVVLVARFLQWLVKIFTLREIPNTKNAKIAKAKNQR